jgi:hypothetical protein
VRKTKYERCAGRQRLGANPDIQLHLPLHVPACVRRVQPRCCFPCDAASDRASPPSSRPDAGLFWPRGFTRQWIRSVSLRLKAKVLWSRNYVSALNGADRPESLYTRARADCRLKENGINRSSRSYERFRSAVVSSHIHAAQNGSQSGRNGDNTLSNLLLSLSLERTKKRRLGSSLCAPALSVEITTVSHFQVPFLADPFSQNQTNLSFSQAAHSFAPPSGRARQDGCGRRPSLRGARSAPLPLQSLARKARTVLLAPLAPIPPLRPRTLGTAGQLSRPSQRDIPVVQSALRALRAARHEQKRPATTQATWPSSAQQSHVVC